MSEREHCAGCGASFQGKEIPVENRHYHGGATHYRREIGIYDRHRDLTVAFQCPDCDYRWDRFTGEEIKGDAGSE